MLSNFPQLASTLARCHCVRANHAPDLIYDKIRLYLLYLVATCVLAEKKESATDIFCKHVTRILRAGQVVLCVLHVPRCHACMLEVHTKITFSRPATAFTRFRPVIL